MSIIMDEYQVKIGLVEPILGTVPKNKEIYKEYIADKARELLAKGKIAIPPGSTVEEVAAKIAEEPATVETVEDRGWTGFQTLDEKPFVFNYVIKGFLKETANVLKDANQLNVTNFKSKVENFVFITPRRIFFQPLDGTELETSVNERPLRAQTAQGPRVSLIRSDTITNASLTFTMRMLKQKDITITQVRALLDFGLLRGVGQWRTASYGQFEVLEFIPIGNAPVPE